MNTRSVPWIYKPSPTVLENLERMSQSRLSLSRKFGPLSFRIRDPHDRKLYRVFIGNKNTCSCKEEFCIHNLFVLTKLFGFPRDNPILYQKGMVNVEIDQMLCYAGDPTRLPKSNLRQAIRCSRRKPSNMREIHEGDVCPICYDDIYKKKHLIHCDHCGNHMHQRCMLIWIKHQDSIRRKVTCTLCREEWSWMKVFNLKRNYQKKKWKPKKKKLKLRDFYWITPVSASSYTPHNIINYREDTQNRQTRKSTIYRHQRKLRIPQLIRMAPIIKSNHFKFSIRINQLPRCRGKKTRIYDGIQIGFQDAKINHKNDEMIDIGQLGIGWGLISSYRSSSTLLLPKNNDQSIGSMIVCDPNSSNSRNNNNSIGGFGSMKRNDVLTMEIDKVNKSVVMRKSGEGGIRIQYSGTDNIKFPKDLQIVVVVGTTFCVEIVDFRCFEKKKNR